MSIKKSKSRRPKGPHTTKPKPNSAPKCAPGTFFTFREHAILARYFGLQHLRPLGAADPALLAYEDSDSWNEPRDGVAVHLGSACFGDPDPIDPEVVDPDPGDSPDPCPSALEAAVGHICLTTAERLPLWEAVDTRTGYVIHGRPLRTPGRVPARVLFSQTIGCINWANSGPGISWPECYHITHVPYYDRWVVTASRDSSDATGFNDWAIHHAPAEISPQQVAREALLRCWRGNAAWGQKPFEELIENGLLDSHELTALARLAWPDKQITEETHDEFIVRTGFHPGQSSELEGGF